MPLWSWSQTSSANATADPTINFAEGQAPSSVNDSARALMAAGAKYRDDVSGAILTSGTSTAFTVTSNSGYDTLAHLHNQIIAFTPHTTNGATVTLNVDGLGAKPLRSAPNVELLAGTIIQGTPYICLFNNSDGAYYLTGLFGNPYNIPLGAGIDYWLPTAPNSSFVFPFGQAISRTTYATLFAAMGTTYGAGDGTTTFNIPDKRDRVSAGRSNMGGVYASRLGLTFFGTDPGVLGAVGGGESHTLTATEQASMSVSASGTASVISTVSGIPFNATTGSSLGNGSNGGVLTAGVLGAPQPIGQISSTGSASVTGTASGGGAAHRTVQPTIVCNYIIRII